MLDTQIKAYRITKQEHSESANLRRRQKFQQKVIRDSNPDFRISLDSDVSRIYPKMLWMHYLVGLSASVFRQVWYKSVNVCMRNANKCPKIPYSLVVKKLKN